MNASPAAAFAPGHITGFFQIFPDGSTGAGLNPALGASTEVSFIEASEDQIELNGEQSSAAVSLAVIEAFSKYRQSGAIQVVHRIDYPIGYGMGMSGAGAFSLSLALNELVGSSLSYKQCMEIARGCEIRCGTGLGDVVAQQFPGVMIGLPPYPSMDVQLIEGEQKYVACAFFEPLSTESIIRNPDWVERINRIGGECMRLLEKDCTRKNFMELSRKFALETELASQQVQAVMQQVPGSSMAMLGQSVFILCSSVEEGMLAFEPYAEHVIVAEIAISGASVRNNGK